MPNHYFQIAKELGDKAKVLSENSKDKNEIMNAFEDAGNSFVNVGFSDEARENYSRALVFATKKSDKLRIEGKIKKLGISVLQKEKIFEDLKNIE